MIEMYFRFAVPAYGVDIEGKGKAARLVPNPPPPDEIAPYWVRSKTVELTDHPALFLEFAALKKSAKSILEFANQFGTIGRASQDTMAYPPAPIHEFISNITWETDEFSSVSKWFPEIDKMNQAVEDWRARLFPGPETTRKIVLLARGTVCQRWSRSTPVGLVFIPDGLLDALWVQFYSAVDRDAQFRQCEWSACGRWFEVGPGSGKRAHARFHSEKCRNDFHNSRRD